MKRIGKNLMTWGSLGFVIWGNSVAEAQLNWGQAANYTVLVGGGGTTFGMSSAGTVNGKVGIGQSGSSADNVNLSGGTINGPLNWQGTYNFGGNGNNNPPNFGGTINPAWNSVNNQNVSAVGSALSTVTGLSSAFGNFYSSGNAISINTQSGGQTIDAKTVGTLEQNVTVNTVNYGSAYVVNVSSVTLNNNPLTINDSGTTKAVVINVDDQNGEFNNGILLGAGLTANQVIINIIANGEFQNAANGAVQHVSYIYDQASGGFNVESPINGNIYVGGGGGVSFKVLATVTGVPEAGTWLAGLFLLFPLGRYLVQQARKPALQ